MNVRIDFGEHEFQGLTELGIHTGFAQVRAVKPECLKDVNDIQQGSAFGIPAEAIAATDAANRFHEPRLAEITHHLREVITGDIELARDIAPGQLQIRLVGELQYGIQAQ